MDRRRYTGRAAVFSTPNRFESVRTEADYDQLEPDSSEAAANRAIETQFLPDETNSVICRNDSPDIPFRFSINPYRGCEHGCAYCYARPGHELLGMNAGIDFETKILVKDSAAALLRCELGKPSWHGDVIAISGVTDCYQPAERRLRITRSCLEVLFEARQAIGIVTKNALVLRDRDLLVPMARRNLVHVNISVTSLDAGLARVMEPRTSSPEARLRAVRELSGAGIPVRVMVAPIIPGLTDHEIPRIMQAARQAGATSACYQLLRLPLAVAPIFLEWLDANYPLARKRVERLIRDTRGGKTNDPRFGHRMRGDGPYAEGIRQTFSVAAKRFGLDGTMPKLDCGQFRPPISDAGQRWLF